MNIISSYSRATAIDDGVLVDVSKTAREAGFTMPVALTRGAWIECVAWDARAKDGGQDEAGRLWDVLWMLGSAIRSPKGKDAGDCIEFAVRCVQAGDGKRVLVPLVAMCGPGDEAEPVITVMLPGED